MNETKADTARKAHDALDELLRLVDLHRVTAPVYLRLDCNQGGVTAVKTGRWIEEIFKPGPLQSGATS